MTDKVMTREEWLEYGIKYDYCSAPFCAIHDGGPMTDTEVELFDSDSDPCILEMRLGCHQDWELDAQAFKGVV